MSVTSCWKVSTWPLPGRNKGLTGSPFSRKYLDRDRCRKISFWYLYFEGEFLKCKFCFLLTRTVYFLLQGKYQARISSRCCFHLLSKSRCSTSFPFFYHILSHSRWYSCRSSSTYLLSLLGSAYPASTSLSLGIALLSCWRAEHQCADHEPELTSAPCIPLLANGSW